LNETNGTTAFDYVNGYNGTYAGSISLAQPGVSYQGFGSPSYCAGFDGNSAYVDIPGGPLDLAGPITILGWVQPSYAGHLTDILGHGDSSYSLAVTGIGAAQFADNGGTCTNATAITDGNWHLVAGVYAGGSGANDFLYVDGVLAASNSTTSVAGNADDLWIGGAPDYGIGSGNRLFGGYICHVAVIPQGLSAAQIQQIYGASGPAPTVSVPASVTVDQGGDGAISSVATGSHPLAYQWFYLNGSLTVLIPGATNDTLRLTDILPVQQNYQYSVVVSNAYGAVTSSYATLNILSGAPLIVTDIFPPLEVLPAGVPVTFAVTASGAEPFSYQWSQGSGAIPGATNASYTFNALAGSNNYSVTVRNSDGSTPSSTAAVVGVPTPPPAVAFNGNGPNWSLNGGDTFSRYAATMSDNVLAIISGGDEDTSAFFKAPQYIGGFFASFTYTASGSVSGGTTFCVQNSTQGAGALGAFCGGLGFTGITPSAAFEITGTGIAFGANGSAGPFSSAAPINTTASE